MKSKEAHYWQAQEDRWYKQWEESQKLVDELESTIMRIEAIALVHIEDEDVRAEVKKIVNTVWRGARS
jgi:hypothetical protein